jgi:hypothetical protein
MNNLIKALGIITVIILFNFPGMCQSKVPDTKNLENKIVELDKAGWEAWKNKNAGWFVLNTTENFVSINSDGISDKSQVIKSISSDCNVKSYSLGQIKFILINENSVFLTYIAT